jgi:acetyl-CoA synthetase (ADP-forming)
VNPLLEQWRAELHIADRPDEYEIKALLARLGLRVPRGIRLLPGAGEVAPDFPGPYVAKVCTPDILHKTECRGVHLNLTPENLPAAIGTLSRAFPEASILVEQMIAFEGPEMIAGGLVDPSFGPAVMVGAGGLLTEILKDAAFRLAPLEETEALRMLAELQIYPVFKGFRNLHMDAAAMAGLIVVVSRLVAALGARFDQLDLNPIVWTAGGWTILDAKLVLHATHR